MASEAAEHERSPECLVLEAGVHGMADGLTQLSPLPRALGGRPEVTLLIGGDLCPINYYEPFFRNKEADRVVSEYSELNRASSLSIANLECPLIESPSAIRKIGPVLGADWSCIHGMTQTALAVVNLANNHILDHGTPGLETTLRLCEGHGIATVGAGMDVDEARKPLVTSVGGLRIGVLAAAEREFSIARAGAAGANPMSLAHVVPDLLGLKIRSDYVIVLLHAGVEGYPYPSPALMDTCHLLVDLGARLVVCQHSHCAGSYEEHGSGLIVYGQGNLLLDMPSCGNVEWNRGVLIRVAVNTSDLSQEYDLIPYTQSRENPGIRLMAAQEAEAFRQQIDARSRRIKDREHVEDEWRALCASLGPSYLSKLLFGSGKAGALGRRLKLERLLLRRKQRLLVLNLIRCESHREVLETMLGAG